VDKIGGLDDAIVKAASLKNKITVLKIIRIWENFNDLLANFPLQNLKLIS
jgi:hypothetical protein